MTLAALAGAIVGTLLSLLYAIGPDVPNDPAVSKQEAQIAQRATWRECARKKKQGERCHPVAERKRR